MNKFKEIALEKFSKELHLACNSKAQYKSVRGQFKYGNYASSLRFMKKRNHDLIEFRSWIYHVIKSVALDNRYTFDANKKYNEICIKDLYKLYIHILNVYIGYSIETKEIIKFEHYPYKNYIKNSNVENPKLPLIMRYNRCGIEMNSRMVIKNMYTFENNVKELSIEITGKCLNRCIFCSGNCSRNNNSFLDIDIIKNVLNQAKYAKLSTIYISGGEPFLHPDIIDILRITRETIGNKVRIVVYTSGIVKNIFGFDTSISKKVLKKCKSYIDEISFDIPSLYKTRYKEMCNGNIDIVLKSLENARKCYKDTNILLSRNFVITNINKGELLQNNNIHTNYMKLVNQGRASDNIERLSINKHDDEIIKCKLYHIANENKIGNPYKMNCVCTAGISKMIITYTGNVYPCDSMKDVGPNGNINNIYYHTLSEIYDGEYFKYIRDSTIKNMTSFREYGSNGCIRNIMYDKNS